MPGRVREALLALRAPRCAYVYDLPTLRATARTVRAALPKGSTLLYAVKANGHPDVLAALAEQVDGFAVASGGELALARIARAGRGRASEIIFSGSAKTAAELDTAVEAEATVNVESALELRRLAVAAETAGARVRATLRVNRAAPVPFGPQPNASFGIDEGELERVVALAAGHPSLRLVGYGLHAVSNNLDAAAHAAFVTDSVRWCVAAAARHRLHLEMVNVGGGLGIDYTGGAQFDLDAFADGLTDAAALLPDGVRLVFEFGRYLAAEAGWYAAEVLDLKRIRGRTFAVLRGGTHHFPLPALRGHSHPFAVVPVAEWPHAYERPSVGHCAPVVVGESGSAGDVLAWDQTVTRLRVGDLLVFRRAGAYGWEVSHHEYSHHDPPEFVITG